MPGVQDGINRITLGLVAVGLSPFHAFTVTMCDGDDVVDQKLEKRGLDNCWDIITHNEMDVAAVMVNR